MNYKGLLLFFNCLFLNILCFSKSEVTVNVWIHGTYPIKNVLTSKHCPFRSCIYVQPGISLAKNLPDNYYFHKLAYKLYAFDSFEYDINNFYTYGWNSSKVRPLYRHDEGQRLYDALLELLKEYKTKFSSIKLRLIGFSHGGNVALHCVRCMPFDLDGVETEVILLATPIQESTRDFVNKSCLNRVYSFYSDYDIVQRIDMQKFHRDAPKKSPLLSSRVFKDADRVIQVRLKINGQFIGHHNYRYIVHYLPEMIKAVNQYIGENKDQANVILDFKIN